MLSGTVPPVEIMSSTRPILMGINAHQFRIGKGLDGRRLESHIIPRGR